MVGLMALSIDFGFSSFRLQSFGHENMLH